MPEHDPQLPPPNVPPPPISRSERRRRRRRRAAAAAAAAIAAGAIGIVVATNWLRPSPAPQATPSAIAVVPTVAATLTAPPTVPPTPALTVPPTAPPTSAPTVPPTAPPTLAPTATPTTPPTPSPSPQLPPDGQYLGSGTFRSFDGSESYATSWRVTKTGATAEVAQLVSPGGAPFQTLLGIVDTSGTLVAVSDDPDFCEVLVLGSEFHAWLDELFVAYGPSSMECPTVEDFLVLWLTLDLDDPVAVEDALRDFYGWGDSVVIGEVDTDGWTYGTVSPP